MRLLVAALVTAIALVLGACGSDDPNAWSPERGCQDAEDIAVCLNSCDALNAGLEYLLENEPADKESSAHGGWGMAFLVYMEDGEKAGCDWAT